MNIDRLHQIIGKAPAGLKGALLYGRFKGDVDLGRLTGDLIGAGRRRQRIGNHAAHIAQRRPPVAIKRRYGNIGRIDRAALVLLADLRGEIAGACARAAFEAAIDDRGGQLVKHQPLIIDDGIEFLVPRPRHDIGDRPRSARLNHDARGAHRVCRVGARRRLGLAEIGRGGMGAHAPPIAEPLVDQHRQQSRIRIATGDNHRIFRAIPTGMKRPHAVLMGIFNAGDRADCGMIGQRLAARHQLPRRILQTLRHTAALALFGQHNRRLDADVAFRQIRRDHHAR